MIHRDDIWKFWTLLVAIAIGLSGNAGVLPRVLEPYKEWIELLAFVGGIVTAWRMKPNGSAPIVVLAVALALGSGCAAGAVRHAVVVTVVSAHGTLALIQDTEMLVVCGKVSAPAAPHCVSPDGHRRISGKLAEAFDYDGQLARVVRAVPTGTPAAAQIADLLGKIRTLVTSILSDLPSSPQVDRLLTLLGGSR